MKGSAWPFFVGDLTCQVDFDNERDYLSLILKMLNCLFLNCTIVDMMREDVYDNRSVMVLDVHLLACLYSNLVGSTVFLLNCRNVKVCYCLLVFSKGWV